MGEKFPLGIIGDTVNSCAIIWYGEAEYSLLGISQINVNTTLITREIVTLTRSYISRGEI